MAQPVHKRKFHVFLSHASSDKIEIVNELHNWLRNVANIPVWYDQSALSGGNSLPRSIGKAISECRAMILVLSSASMKSPWVQKEYSLAERHRMEYRDFRIIPVLIDNCEIPEFLRDSLYIDVRENKLTSTFYRNLLQAIYPFDPFVELRATSDIYISRTWRYEETVFADHICQKFMQSDFRLIGDSKDHPQYNEGEGRVESIVSSCGGLLAILPYREGSTTSYHTSEFCLDEISIAKQYGVPSIVIAEPGVNLPDDLITGFDYFYPAETKETSENQAAFDTAIERMRERWRKPPNEHHVFLATSFNSPETIYITRQVIQQITGMPCLIGQDVETQNRSIQEAISELIRKASLVIVNASHNNANVLIEAGIARGANVNYRIFARESTDYPKESTPFMLLDKSVKFYKNDTDYIGSICRLAYPFRRRVLNYELQTD